ncbi:MAG: PilZ domain-containing protein [Pontixanthobacter sp.]
MFDKAGEDGPGDIRRDPRHPVAIPGRYRRGAGLPTDVQFLDLSRSGCRFFDKFGNLKVGSEITLRISTFGPIVSAIRWRKDSYVGVAFEPPLHEAVLDHITAQFPI